MLAFALAGLARRRFSLVKISPLGSFAILDVLKSASSISSIDRRTPLPARRDDDRSLEAHCSGALLHSPTAGRAVQSYLSCFVPGFISTVNFSSSDSKDALWARFFTGFIRRDETSSHDTEFNSSNPHPDGPLIGRRSAPQGRPRTPTSSPPAPEPDKTRQQPPLAFLEATTQTPTARGGGELSVQDPPSLPNSQPVHGREVGAGSKFKPGKQNLCAPPIGQRFKLSARERTARELREYATGAAMGARTGGIWATLARGGAGNRLARAKSASAAPTLATTAALIGRTG